MADLHHDTRQVAALPGGEGRREPIVQHPGTDLRLTGVDSRGTHLHKHVRGSGYWTRHLTHLQDIDVAVLVELHCLSHAD
ncbi:Uncharacterised protein [Mycobacteroides abscessus subsp. massiliense]|nr:Uncharacterised protein [Mycobacteroides abscessus subsp. massiliense]